MLLKEKKKNYQVMGIDISPYSKNDFFQLIEERLQDNDPLTDPYFVVTVNPEIVVQSIIDSEFRNILESSSINTADGVGISWAIDKLYGKKLDRITGSDSVENICELCATYNQSVFMYGAMPNIADQAAEILKQHIDGLIIAGTYSPDRPDINFESLPLETQQQLEKANVIFVALGAPAQEKWIHTNLHYLPNCKLIIGIGGSLDFIAGKIKRAPVIMRRTGIEWLYRLIHEPSRWRRMMRLPLFALNILFIKASIKKKT